VQAENRGTNFSTYFFESLFFECWEIGKRRILKKKILRILILARRVEKKEDVLFFFSKHRRDSRWR
jgi:hypothetical protein